MIIISHAQRHLRFMPLLGTLCVSALSYVDTIVKFLLTSHFSTVTGLECLAMISHLSSFLPFATLGTSILFSFSVPTQSVECLIFSLLTNSGLLKKFSSHSLFKRPNKGSRSSSTIAAVLGVSGVSDLTVGPSFFLYIQQNATNILFLIRIVRKLLCPQCHSWVNSWTKCTNWKHAGRIPASTEHMLTAKPNERLNHSLPIYRRNWHVISMLTSGQQHIWSSCNAE